MELRKTERNGTRDVHESTEQGAMKLMKTCQELNEESSV